jgi:hypothetical protein
VRGLQGGQGGNTNLVSAAATHTGDAAALWHSNGAQKLLDHALIFLVRADTAVSSHAQCHGL